MSGRRWERIDDAHDGPVRSAHDGGADEEPSACREKYPRPGDLGAVPGDADGAGDSGREPNQDVDDALGCLVEQKGERDE